MQKRSQQAQPALGKEGAFTGGEDEFIRERPKTRGDWFRTISQHSRTNIDSKQVGQYLDRVLEIIGEYD
ncbi:MAG: hypothetical protein WB992_01535 [Bryobacteraceae bacterium]